MAICSMTGYARVQGETDEFSWSWEVKSVNGRGLDIRLRLPSLLDSIDIPARKRLGGQLTRGSVMATLELQRTRSDAEDLIDEERLASLLAIGKRYEAHPGVLPPRLDGLLALRGVMDRPPLLDDTVRAALESGCLAGLDDAIESLVAMRRDEGSSLAAVLDDQLAQMDELTAKAQADPATSLNAIRARISDQIDELLEGDKRPDDDRLAQEATMIAIRQDIREEIDRMVGHIAAARKLLNNGGVVGRKLDFLSQEMNREANTICSKAGSASLKETGLGLKAVVDQFREQIQNIE